MSLKITLIYELLKIYSVFVRNFSKESEEITLKVFQ